MTEREALKLALDALDCIYSPLHVREINKVGAAMTAIREVLSQPEQEPEAWYDKHGMVTHDPFEGVTPLYTTPPQRTWVGLTENEFKQIMLDTYNIDLDVPGHSSDDHLLWKVIEQKLRSKNT